MKNWFLRIWHRFTLGRTAREIGVDEQERAHPGTVANLAFYLRDAALEVAPAGFGIVLCSRDARDLPPRRIRIVIEQNQ